MKGGRIVEHGTYKELLARGVDFHAALDEGPGSANKPPITSAHSSPGPSAASTAVTARAASVSGAPLLPAPDFFQQADAAPRTAGTASDMPLPTGLTGVAAEVTAAEPTPDRGPSSRDQGHGEAATASMHALAAHAEDGAAAAEEADCKTLDLVPLLAPTINGGAVPEAASGALPDPAADPTAPRGRDAVESRGWRDEDGKVAGGRNASRKGRLVYVRLSQHAQCTIANHSSIQCVASGCVTTVSTHAMVMHRAHLSFGVSNDYDLPVVDRNSKLEQRADPAQREARAEGSVDKNVYWQYLTAWSPYFVVPIVMLAAATTERSLQVRMHCSFSVARPTSRP